ncbi:Uncharacterized protein PPKH_1837 [Pseudomonas putida]|nr:Uncharacterized protein PPKH_1837 [Pseudomonas putida]
MQACGMSVLHAKLCIIHQCLGHRAQVVSGPDHHRFLAIRPMMVSSRT